MNKHKIDQDNHELVAEFGGGYGWSKVYYDKQSNTFFEDSFHTGSVDDAATWYDGRRELSKEELENSLISSANYSLLSKLWGKGIL